MATFLFELRTEEIPAGALPGAREQLERLFAEELTASGFSKIDIRALSTSRRLIVIVEGLPDRQPDRREEMTGPPVKVAFAEDGSPTPAGEGFARKVGLPLADVQRADTPKGEYLSASVVHKGRETGEILAELVPSVIAALRFPKMMRWGSGEHFFVRPVHGVVALLDDSVVSFEVFGIATGRSTVGHRVHAPESFELSAASDYSAALAERGVVVDPSVRREKLETLASDLAAEKGAHVHSDPALMAEHVELVEWPGLLAGAFDKAFLELPSEVVVTTLRYHQKCLVLEDSEGVLQPGFIAVVDRRDDPEGLIQLGNEWVIGARLADAGFFFTEDRKREFADHVSGLDRLEFHRVLGSLNAKAVRVGELAVIFSDFIKAGIDRERLRGATLLAKADLLSQMVGEFPELQGVMGGHYLRLEGADEGIWTAVRDHYRPVGFDGEIPASVEGRLLGVADRLDTVAGLFAVGERPTGSKDPFGLRRAAQGVVKIVVEAGWDLDLGSAIDVAVAGVAAFGEDDEAAVAAAVRAFMADRVRRWLTDLVGVSGDTADAVMAAGWDRLPETVARAEALERVRGEDAFRSLALAFKRVRNITDGQPDSDVDPSLFEEDEEHELYEATNDFHTTIEDLLPEGRVDEAFAAMKPIAEILDRFFIEVLVMAEEERVRSNRIALLKSIGRNFLILADLSRLQVEGGEQ